MKIVETTGCVYNDITIDGVNTKDMTREAIYDAVNRIVSHIITMDDPVDSIMSLLDGLGPKSTELSGPCDTCRDYIYTTTWEIKIGE